MADHTLTASGELQKRAITEYQVRRTASSRCPSTRALGHQRAEVAVE